MCMHYHDQLLAEVSSGVHTNGIALRVNTTIFVLGQHLSSAYHNNVETYNLTLYACRVIQTIGMRREPC